MDPAAKRTFRLIVGLGNPGEQYVRTRHNMGFMILDAIVEKMGIQFHTSKPWHADVATHEGVTFCKPLGFMNCSGEAARAMSDYFKIPASEMLVVLDDAALPLGKLRIRPEGSAGGHNGLQSIIDQLGTQEIPRLRIGIGLAENHAGLADHVLSVFAPDEMPLVEEAIGRAAEAVGFAQINGVEAAMNQFN